MSERDEFDLDDLARAMRDATPRPDAARKADVLARAQENFDAVQGMSGAARPTSERPAGGRIRGVRDMLHAMKTRTMLGLTTAATAVAAVSLLAVLPSFEMPRLGGNGPVSVSEAALDAEEMAPVVLAEPVVAAEPVVVAEAESAADAPMVPREAPGALTRMAAPDTGAAVLYSGQAVSPETGEGRAVQLPLPVPDRPIVAEADTEAYPDAEANPVKITAEEPVSTFSIDVDTASWAMVRRALSAGQLPPEGAVRIEEMVNYFTYDYAAPEPGGEAFAPSVAVMQTPWNAGTQLVRIGLQAELPQARPPMNLVFLIDTSGSMNQPDKLPLLIQSFRLMLGELSAEDQVSIATYAGSAGRVLEPTPASDRETILAALERLQAGGGTAGQDGLQQAYATAAEMARDGAVSRVILATDGDFNIGLSDPGALEAFIAEKREAGTYLSVLGFGRGNLDDATMQALAQTGNGIAAYIDTLAEAQKVLVDQLTGALVPVANDAKIQVEFNPATVAEYRLIGYETRALSRTDFNNDRVDAGDIGAGHQVTALYEVTPVGSDAVLSDPLRYGDAAAAGGSDELGFLRLRYKVPGETESRLIEAPIAAVAAPGEAGFAAAIAGFGQLLTGSEYVGDWGYAEAIALAQAHVGEDPFGYRREAVTLLRLAQSMDR
ncbi:VWA domain-containing protein [Cognatishimia sp. F0-27]|uniref:vWA domain-containing protein n=1 Tax=Cognatishimia sp. F0-27 TaxID=2816855 RepID=UPI001D0C2E75|nr:VWA domain-containing protein [Cognatishimia sp. F0-27]MCC1491393.1 VWA domain-containing protein [Cognatishimia sp. F0-27]